MNMKILAVAVVAVVAIAGIGVGLAVANNDSSSGITIVDGSGKTVSIDKPLSNVAVINKNIPRVLIMYKLESTVSCYHYKDPIGAAWESTATKLGTYYTPSVETLLEKNVEAVLCPVSSMTLYASYQTACENVGIKVIRLDCNGASLYDDMTKLSKLFGEPENATKVLNEYQSNYDKIVEAAKAKIESSSATRPDFMIAGSSSIFAVYNHTSAASTNFGKIFGKNITTYTDLSTKGVTNAFDTGTIEVLQSVQDKLGVLVIRGGTGDKTIGNMDTAYARVVGDASHPVTQDATAVKNGQAYVLNNNLSSGLGMPMGILILAEKIYGDFSVTLTFNGTEKTYSGLAEVRTAIIDFLAAYSPGAIDEGSVLLASYAAGSYTGVAVATL